MANQYSLSNLHGLNLEPDPIELRGSSSYYCHGILLLLLQAIVKNHLCNHPATEDQENVKVDVEVKSWKESDEWDLINDKRDFIIHFRLDFKVVCT
ncbi:crp fnr family transcriptional regulator [Lasius niger]|uniref:Crp fnr family transcriptional regulator n=1 Tax=Lasius niger TaxID=67767 RepID=A0A0J7KD00_LASNI|nr:crp fnr family transcriptional regulator [Lasius niger]